MSTLGYKHTNETRIKMSLVKKGKPSNVKGKHWNHSEEAKRKIGLAHKKIGAPWMKGNKISEETRMKLIGNKNASGSRNGKMSGENHPNWKGGITPINRIIRNSTEYKQWRSDVFKRDNWTCQTCGMRGSELHAHHIKPFAKFPELRLIESNGVTLCAPCHDLAHNYKDRNK